MLPDRPSPRPVPPTLEPRTSDVHELQVALNRAEHAASRHLARAEALEMENRELRFQRDLSSTRDAIERRAGLTPMRPVLRASGVV